MEPSNESVLAGITEELQALKESNPEAYLEFIRELDLTIRELSKDLQEISAQ